MLALNALPFALVLGLLSALPSTLAAPCNSLTKRAISTTSAPASSSSSSTDGFCIPEACSSTCAAFSTLVSLDSCTTDTCASYCAAGGLDPYVDCSNCVLENASPSLSKDDYDSIVSGLVLVLQSCSAAGAAVAPSIDLVDFNPLNSTTSPGSAGTTTTTPAVKISGFPTDTLSGSSAAVATSTSTATATALPATNVAASVNDQAIGASSHALAAVRPARAAAVVGAVVGLAVVSL